MPLRLPKVRGDLQYFEQELEGEDVVVVRDPVRGTYFKYNLLQAAMLRALDGVRSLDDMIAGLAAEYEVDIPRAAAERFVAHARKMLLLDVASYAVPGARPAAKVMAALRRRGLRFEGPPPSPDGAMAATTALFTAALRQLHLGRPAAALDYLTALLELDPDNARARELADAIQTAYLHAQSGRTSDFPTFLKLNPTPILRWLDRTIGKIAFHWIGGVLLAALVVLAVACYSITPFPETQLDAFDIALAIAVNTAYSFLHELGHALACFHYGGDVPEIGLTLFYYIRPLPYCDTSSSYLFTDRRHKLAVQLGGTVASMIVLCSIFVILAIVHPTIFFYQAMLVNLWVAVVMMFLNLVPFLKFDGYYALGDYAGVPNLRERSFKLLAAWLGARVLGLETREEPLSPGKRALFFGFAVVSLAFTAVWMYWAMFQLLAPVVEHFRGPGLIAAVLGLAYLVRGALFVPLGRLIAAVVRARRRVFTWRRSLVLAALAGAAATPWLIDGPVRVDADFVLVPRARADIRAEAAGWIDRVLVAEGDRVAAGQPVAILRDPELDRRLRGLELERAALDAELAALRQGTRPEALALADRQLGRARAQEADRDRRAAVATMLADAGLGTAAAAAETTGTAAISQAMAVVAHRELQTLAAGTRPEDLAAAAARRDRLTAAIDQVRLARDRLTVRSPIAGVIATKHLADLRSAWLARGDRFAEVHDTSAFRAEIQLPASAPLGELAAGDAIALRQVGAPDAAIACALSRVRDADRVAISTPFGTSGGRTGMIGHARLYGRRYSLIYAELILPLERAFRVDLWGIM